MHCRDFEERIDQYVDSVMPASQLTAAADHVRTCKGCNDLVTSYQHASALLRAAVADKAAAVDVSGLWQAIDAKLGSTDAGVESLAPQGGRESVAARLRRFHPGRRLRDLAIGILGPAPLRAGAFAAAAAAVALFLIAGPARFGGEKMVAENAEPTADLTAVASRSDLDAKPRAKHVRIDNIDIAPGKSVATWSKPRTRTQVIWVNGPDDEFGVSNATHAR